MPSEPTSPDTDKLLTKRQKQILRYLADELYSNEIGKKLHITTKTVEYHRQLIKRRLGVRGVVGMVRYATRIGLIEA